jgi:hypothetical protein
MTCSWSWPPTACGECQPALTHTCMILVIVHTPHTQQLNTNQSILGRTQPSYQPYALIKWALRRGP